MRWFKHMTRSWNDEKIALAVELGGLEAYGLYFRLLEIVAGNMENDSAPECEYSVKRWSRDCGLLSNRFERLLKVLAKCSLLSENTSEGLLKVTIPNIAKYRDEYSVKQERRKVKSPDTLRTDSGQTPDQEQIQIQKQIQNRKKELPAEKSKDLSESKKPNAWGMWVDVNREFKRVDPAAIGKDLKAAKSLFAEIADPEKFKDILRQFLADDDKFLVQNGHGLSFLASKINKYLNSTYNPDDIEWEDGYTFGNHPDELAFIMAIEEKIAAEKAAKEAKERERDLESNKSSGSS